MLLRHGAHASGGRYSEPATGGTSVTLSESMVARVLQGLHRLEGSPIQGAEAEGALPPAVV